MILAFDLYGTLFSTEIPGVPREVMAEWRRKQLEFTWRLTLMGEWRDFDEVTRLALEYVREEFKVKLDDRVLEEWKRLKPFPDIDALREIREEKWVLTNGVESTAREILKNANALDLIKGVFSAERVKAYKPSERVYKAFLQEVGEAVLISSNPFDVAGAKRAGMKAIYVRRAERPHSDFLGFTPDAVVESLWELEGALRGLGVRG
ncbi:MAG: haloacid dehalogenase type II [Thermoprotei archaeon]